MNLSNRAINTPSSPIRKFAPLEKQAVKEGVHVFRLNIGQPDLKTPRKILKTFRKFSGDIVLYAPSQGMPETVEAWKRYYLSHGIRVESSDIIVTMGGSEALLFSMMAVADPGDEILVFEPFYTNFAGFAAMAGVILKPLTLTIENGFELPSQEEIESQVTEKTKAIIINNPNNPTGVVYSREEMQVVVNVAYKKKLFVISDEVYREFNFNKGEVPSILEFPEIEDRAILIDSVSKRFNHCGGRVGCVVSRNIELMGAMLRFAQARLSVPTLEQLSVNPLLTSPKEYTDSIREEYRARRDIVYNAIKDVEGIRCFKPEGSFYLIVGLPIEDAEDFVSWMLTDFRHNNKTVMVTPAAGFYMTPGLGKDEIRIAYVLAEKDLEEAMTVFKLGLEKYLEGKNEKA
jgi:aspartate aminotransferase